MQQASDRWVSITLSVLLHAALLGLLVYGWLLYRKPPRPAPTLAIEAQVVDARAVRGALQPSPPQPPPPAPPQEVEPLPPAQPPTESAGPPQPSPEELAQREQAEAAAQQKAADEAARKQAEELSKARQAAEAQKRAAEEQRKVEEQRKAEAREASEREADLQRSLAAEAQTSARAGPALANWEAQIAAKITRAWLRPPTARPGIECMLYVTQVPGGEVTQVSIGDCNGDQAVRESIQAAVYRASPLPPPPDPALFDRNLKIDFKPD
jgi:colicin import membrane protein